MRLKSDIINIRQAEEKLCQNDIKKQRENIFKMGETSQSILPLKNVFDFLKKKVLFTLSVFKKTFGRVVFFLSFFFFLIYLFFYFIFYIFT